MRTATQSQSDFIRSADNPLVKRFRRALNRGELTPDGCCAVEGEHLLEEALRTREVEIVTVLAAESAKRRLGRLRARHGNPLPCRLMSDRVFRSLSQTENPQGLAALVRLPERRLEDSLHSSAALVAVLDGVADPGNFGSILRGLEAFGGSACLLTPGSVKPYNAKAVRASAGSVFRVPVFTGMTTPKASEACHSAGLTCIGLVAHGGKPLDETDLIGPVAFFVGNEARGLPEEADQVVDGKAEIPLGNPVESLNAAVAASLAFYETARQRRARRR